MDEETFRRLLALPGRLIPQGVSVDETHMRHIADTRQATIQHDIAERNTRLFAAEAEKLDGWADDLKLSLEREIKELDRQIRETRRAATAALTLEDKLVAQKQIRALEAQRNHKRRTLFDAQDRVDKLREQLIADIMARLTQKALLELHFSIRWLLR